MHRTRHNALVLDIHLSPKGPLLVKHGGISANPTLPDMQFVRTHHAVLGETVYVPGSSLKGVVRSFVEKVLRTMDNGPTVGPTPEKGWRWACATFEARGQERDNKSRWNCPQFLSDEREVLPRLLGGERRELYPCEIYRWSCGACRIFGHTRLKGRVSFTDLAPVGEVRTEIRYGVAISRLSQAVAIGPFETEAVVEGTFAGQIVMENFELWQVGLIALALRAIDAGLVKIGFGKNRGFGEVSLVVTEARLDEVPSGLSANVWRGIGSLAKASALGAYGLQPSDRLAGLPDPKAVEKGILYVRRTYDAAAWNLIVPRLAETLRIDRGQG